MTSGFISLLLTTSTDKTLGTALWMACGEDGVWKYDGKDVTRYPLGNGAYAISIYCDQGGKLWIGTIEHGIFIFEGGHFEPFKPHEPRK